MQKLLLFLCLFLSLILHPSSFADEVIRDANGKIVATITDTPNGRVIRDANGKIVGYDSQPSASPTPIRK